MKLNKSFKYCLIEIVLLPKIVANGGLVETLLLVEELGHLLRGLCHQVVRYEELDALLRLHVELFLAHCQVLLFGPYKDIIMKMVRVM